MSPFGSLAKKCVNKAEASKIRPEITMTDRSLLSRISSNLSILAGKPTVLGTRLSVEFLLNLLFAGKPLENGVVA